MTGRERFSFAVTGGIASAGVLRALQLERQADAAEADAAAWAARAKFAEDGLREAGELVAQLRRQLMSEQGPALGADMLDVLMMLVGLFS